MAKKYKVKYVFDLDKYIKENYKEIVQTRENGGVFNWDDRAVTTVYKLIDETINYIKTNQEVNDVPYSLSVDSVDRDDLIQDCATKFFTYIVYNFDPERDIKISTYAGQAWYREIERILNNNERLFNKTMKKLDNKYVKIDGKTEPFLYNMVDSSSYYNSSEKYDNDLYRNFLRSLAMSDSIVYRYYYEGKSLQEIAEENKKFGYGPKSHEGVRIHLIAMKEKLKQEINESGLMKE